jgi:hypothetical protein
MTDAELQAQYQAAVAQRLPSRARCPSPEQLQALVEQSGAEEDRLETLDHAMSCSACHRELTLLQAIHAAQPRNATLMPRQWLAAATLLIVLAGGTLLTRGLSHRPTDDITRGAPSVAGGDGVVVVAPLAEVSGEPLHALSWHAVPGAVRYVPEVLDDADRVLYTTQTTDTAVTLPALNVRPTAWWVRAVLSDGTERRSPIIRLDRNR